jgi:hypothetical protein
MTFVCRHNPTVLCGQGTPLDGSQVWSPPDCGHSGKCITCPTPDGAVCLAQSTTLAPAPRSTTLQHAPRVDLAKTVQCRRRGKPERPTRRIASRDHDGVVPLPGAAAAPWVRCPRRTGSTTRPPALPESADGSGDGGVRTSSRDQDLHPAKRSQTLLRFALHRGPKRPKSPVAATASSRFSAGRGLTR